MRSASRTAVVRVTAVVAVLLAGAGCGGPAQVVWSPDGSRGLYRAMGGDDAVALIDADGHVEGHLDDAGPGTAWTADSATLYFGGSDDEDGPAPAPVSHRWVGGGDDEPAAAARAGAAAVCRWHAGVVDRVVAINRAEVADVELSPDGRWLAIATQAGHQDPAEPAAAPDPAANSGGAGLYAYALRSARLYRISAAPAPISFTGPDRLAIVETTGPDVGRIVEVSLDESATGLDRTVRATVLPDATPPPRSVAGGLLFLTTAGTFPAPPTTRPVAAAVYRARSDGQIDRLAEASGIGSAFAVSPDGRRVLFTRPSGRAGPSGTDAGELAVMDADGSHCHRVMDLSPLAGLPLTPAWHGNDRVTFVSDTGQLLPDQNGGTAKTAYDVVDYDVPADGPLRLARTLSGEWPTELKPSLTRAPAPTVPGGPVPR
jgi:hypothetical protein